MKGIILAGGKATRLYPISTSVPKSLIPVYDKPMIYYPLSTLMMSGIREILIISTPRDLPKFEELLGDGRQLGLKLSYKQQENPKGGLAQAFIIGEEFIAGDSVCLILGDNIFHGYGFQKILMESVNEHILDKGGIIFGYPVKDPQRYGVVEFDTNNKVVSIEEKPQNPKSNYAVPGIYFYDSHVIEIARNLVPSARGELEITDVNKVYLHAKRLKVKLLNDGFAWLDAGTFESLQQSSNYIQTIQERQGIKIGCIEEISLRLGYVGAEQFSVLVKNLEGINNDYLDYLKKLEKDLRWRNSA